MAKMVVSQSAGIEVPAGRYVVQFLGTEDRDPIKDSKFGNEGAPRMGWLFEVREGPHKGKGIAQESGCKAGPRTNASRMIQGLVGGPVDSGTTVDTDTFIGKWYLLKVAVNPASEKQNLHVADLEPYQKAATPAPAQGGPPPAAPVLPPKKPAAAASSALDPAAKFWMQMPNRENPELETAKDIQDWIALNHVDPATIDLYPEHGSAWAKADTFGFQSTVPW